MSQVPGDGLESWKDIAAYLSRGVRTVRRWEREEGLPVHRHVHRKLGSVYASKSEIDAWRRTRGSGADRTPVSAVAPAAAAAAAKSIAVLPFTNLSADAANQDFADGLTDELLRNLSVVDGLEVRSRTSSFAFKGQPRNLRDIGQ